jgi:hypothetical protein
VVGVCVCVEAKVANFYNAWAGKRMLPYSKTQLNWEQRELSEGAELM